MLVRPSSRPQVRAARRERRDVFARRLRRGVPARGRHVRVRAEGAARTRRARDETEAVRAGTRGAQANGQGPPRGTQTGQTRLRRAAPPSDVRRASQRVAAVPTGRAEVSRTRARPRLLRASPRRRRAAAVSPRASFGRYGAFSDPDAVYLVTELIEGPDLWSILYRLAERNSERRDPFGLDFYNVGLRGPPFVRTTQRRTIVVSFSLGTSRRWRTTTSDRSATAPTRSSGTSSDASWRRWRTSTRAASRTAT